MEPNGASDCSLTGPADPHRLREHEAAAAEPARNRSILASAFSEFIAASARLESSYRLLQQEVNELRMELSERNADLKKSLSENENMRRSLQQIVDSMPCGVLVLNRASEIAMINPEAKHLLGLHHGHSRMIADLETLALVTGVDLEVFRSAMVSNDTVQEFSVTNEFGQRWIELRNRRLSASADPNGLEQTILILRDVTSRRRAEQEREAGRTALAFAEVTTMLAHEIRNPLASMELFTELILQDDERREEWVSHLRAGIRSLSATVNNVLSLHAGSLKLEPLRLDVALVQALEFVKPLAIQAGVDLQWVIASDEAWIRGNGAALKQVILNLVSNAVRHTPAGGAITATLRLQERKTPPPQGESARQLLLDVCDSGSGIRPEQINQIFNAGFSGDGEGSGLGLAVCDRIMKQHGGHISVANQESSGARFTLCFPVIQTERAAA